MANLASMEGSLTMTDHSQVEHTRNGGATVLVDESLRLSRRAILAFGTTALAASVAGCAGFPKGKTNTSTASPTVSPNPVVKQISFEGEQMAVHLEEGHDVSRINLIAPDGSQFTTTTVPEGATKVTLQIIETSRPDRFTYAPGTYDLVTITGDSSTSIPVDLQPNPQISAVDPAPTADQPSAGKLRVTVANTGSAPTWVYNIAYLGAPAPNPKKDIDNAVLRFETPESPIVPPGEQTAFVSSHPPLLIDERDDVTCRDGQAKITVVVQTPHGDVEQQITALLSGGVKNRYLDGHTCQNVTIETTTRTAGGNDA